ncbi:MAG: hypothetical protein KGH64_04505 [Candidatus Micrarchaeota archaeon]|nr:hypothetical protein [Candidatus Micrarchaeota archaeon]
MEREVINHLKGLGWQTMRSAGSKGKIDIMAWKGARCLLIQCKNAKLTNSQHLKLLTELLPEQGIRLMSPLILSGEWKKELKSAIK